MEQYYARICWNTKGWVRPSGPKPERGTYAAKDGFGHEEWLFNFEWILNDYHYAFLQPLNRSSRTMSGKTISVLLWAIDANKRHVQIGEIKNCQVLTDSQAEEARARYREKGWLKQMNIDITEAGGKAKPVSDFWFNIRFRPNDAIQYDPFPVAQPTERIAKLARYNLVLVDNSTENTQWMAATRQGSITPPTPRSYERAGSQGITVNPQHPVFQAELMRLLQKQFGENSIECESNWVDLTVNSEKKKILIEIKTVPTASGAIREALGQILEYAFLRLKLKSADTELFIVAPGEVDEVVSTYLKLLRDEFNIPIRYCQFWPGSKLPDAFKIS